MNLNWPTFLIFSQLLLDFLSSKGYLIYNFPSCCSFAPDNYTNWWWIFCTIGESCFVWEWEEKVVHLVVLAVFYSVSSSG